MNSGKIKSWIFRKKRRWISLGFFLVVFIFFLFCLPTKLFDKATSTILLDKNNHLLSARIADDGQWRFPPNDSVPLKFRTCLIQFEDRNFDSHWGVHLPSIARAIQQNLKAKKVVSGGSTISMQVIRMSRDNPSRTIWEKLKEMIRALRLESRFSKNEIMAMYASHAPMGGNVVGLDAASWRYFNRSAYDLSWAESATLAVLPNAPALIYPGKNQDALKSKRDRLLKRLLEENIIDEITYELSCLEPLPQKNHRLPQLAQHLTDQIIKENGKGITHLTSLDKNLQIQVQNLVKTHSERLTQSQIHNAAVLVLDVKNNHVLAYVGNSKSKDGSKGDHVDIIRAPRSTGSILKPFLYASMLNEGELLPKMLVQDIPVNFTGYAPKNYSYAYEGATPADRALSKSLNVPAVYMLRDFGVQKFHDQLKKMNFHHFNRPSSDYGLALILGGGEASLWEISNAYASMSRDLGNFPRLNAKYLHEPYQHASYYKDFKCSEKKLKSNSFLDAGSVYQTFEALLKVNRPNNEIGWENFSSSHKIAWKTGTSFGFRDAWAIGTTPDYVVGVWVGNADGEGRPGIVGVKAAAPLLFEVYDLLPSGSWFEIPHDDLQELQICKTSGHLASDNCQEKEDVLVPIAPFKTKPCPYHQTIHVNSMGLRVNQSCTENNDIHQKSCFVLPGIQEWYYRKIHPEYINLPDFDPACHDQNQEENMQIIYPKFDMDLYIPIDIDGKMTKAVFKASHRKENQTIFWHLDHEYIGETQEIHHMEVRPSAGQHILTLVDEEGQSISRQFDILEKEN